MDNLDDRTKARRRILQWAKGERRKVGDESLVGALNMAMLHIGSPLVAGSAAVYRYGQSSESLREELNDMLMKGAAEGWLT